jgi:hypothetical protein
MLRAAVELIAAQSKKNLLMKTVVRAVYLYKAEQSKLTTFVAALENKRRLQGKMTNKVNQEPSKKNILYHDHVVQQLEGCWKCQLCKFCGQSVPLVQHFQAKHHITTLSNVQATANLPQIPIDFQRLYKDKCVRLIQSAWRRSISCPLYSICVKRLQLEFDTFRSEI